MRFVPPVLLLACASAPEVAAPWAPSAPLPAPEVASVALLHPPFHGWFQTSNVFDHGVDPTRPLVGPVLDWQGKVVLGSRDHHGWDFELPPGTPVLAPADGVVRQAGPMRPFLCGVLGREVSDQLAVVVEHVGPDGAIYQTSLHHLSTVTVEEGQHVRQGTPVGTSGNSGCSTGPHLHLAVDRLVDGRRASVDPFGWEGGLPDPWASAQGGAASVWLWAEAPPLTFTIERVPPSEARLPVYLAAVRYRGPHDVLRPEDEAVTLQSDPRFAPAEGTPLAGWSLRFPDGTGWTFPVGTQLAGDAQLQVTVGAGPPPAIAHARPLLPDEGGEVELLDPAGAVVDTIAWGLSTHRDGPPEAPSDQPSCPRAELGCVVLPEPGPVASPRFSPDGALAVVVGTRQVPLVLRPGGSFARVDHIAGGRGAPEGAAHLAWLGPEVLVFDAPRADGARTVWYAVPGLPAAPAFTGAAVDEREVADARLGVLIALGVPAGAPELLLWRRSAPEAVAVTRHREPERLARLAPGEREVAFVRSGRLHVLDLVGGTESLLLHDVGEASAVAWWRGAPVVLSGGRLLRAGASGGETLAEGLVSGVLADLDGEVLVAAVPGALRVWTSLQAPPVDLPVAGEGISAVALGRAGVVGTVAWVARFAPGAPAGLGVIGLPGSAAPGSAAP